MNKKTIIIALLTIVLGTITASADIVKGRVVDSETKEPLPEAQIQFVQTYDIAKSFMNMTADSVGCFNFFASGRGSIEVSMLGYYSKSKPVLAFSDSRKDTLDIGAIELKMSPQMLKMVVVSVRWHNESLPHPMASQIATPSQGVANCDTLLADCKGGPSRVDAPVVWA